MTWLKSGTSALCARHPGNRTLQSPPPLLNQLVWGVLLRSRGLIVWLLELLQHLTMTSMGPYGGRWIVGESPMINTRQPATMAVGEEKDKRDAMQKERCGKGYQKTVDGKE